MKISLGLFLIAFLLMPILGTTFGVLFVYATVLPHTRPIVNCTQFSSYNEAVRAYNMGAWKLDGNHNGVPCENLLP